MSRYTPRGARNLIARKSLGLARRWGALGLPPEPEPHPAGFRNWLDRRSLKLKGGFPESWRDVDPPAGPSPRLAVVVHVHFPELLPEILEQLAHVRVGFDLLITNSSGIELTIDPAPEHARSTVVLPVPNRGRDILPLISLVNAGLLDAYDLVLKVHTKKSAWREDHPTLAGDGGHWRDSFLTTLVGSMATVDDILDRFSADPSLGLLTAPGNIAGPEHWGADEPSTRALLHRLQLELDPESLQFAAGSMYWVRGFILQGLRALDLEQDDFEEEAGQIDGTTAHAVERLIGIVAAEAGYRITTTDEPALAEPASGTGREWLSGAERRRPIARAVPFYLPQFHTFPENDRWWGAGFTEWSNVAAAQPVFDGQNQPLLPGELGFYDLRDETVRPKQAEMARSAGLSGFMYYHYWFAGTQLMNFPVERHADDPDSGPFCIMWANENWTRRWDGSDSHVLIAQDYDRAPARGFIEDVLPLLRSEHYIRVGGRPLVAVYRISQMEDYREVMEEWRRLAVEAGLPGLHIVSVDVGGSMEGVEGAPRDHGVDAYLEFAPHNQRWSGQDRRRMTIDPRFAGNLMNYQDMVEGAEARLVEGVEDARYPGVMVNFDNTARRQWNPDIWYGSNPYTFRRWLRSAAESVMDRPWDERLVFVNAWNEWAEGAVLEPSQRFGSSYLLATRDALHY